MRVLFVLIVAGSSFATALSWAERLACEVASYNDNRVLRWAHIAIERIYYLRSVEGWMLYVGQTVDEDKRWAQHVQDGRNTSKAKSNWAPVIDRAHCSVVRLCWTYKQTMRVERRRTLSIYYAFSLWTWLQLGQPRKIHNISNTPADPRRRPKAWEKLVAVLWIPAYLVEGWLWPNAQWATPISWEQLDVDH